MFFCCVDYAIGLALVGRYAVVVAYNSGVQYAAELVPAQVQAGGVAAIHVAGYAASILSPQVLYLVNTMDFIYFKWGVQDFNKQQINVEILYF
jgi:MFS transporter, OCT family, solute carrier family 22 (organic cation transporter), member 4/5